MSDLTKLIQQIDLTKIDELLFERRYVGCIVLNQEGKIMLQQRGADWPAFPGCLATFGGSIEAGEGPMEALVRELKEELGARVSANDVVNIGTYTEAVTRHSELVYGYFWHDKQGSITGCYEGKIGYYDHCAAALAHPKIMDDVRWLLQECQQRGLLDS